MQFKVFFNMSRLYTADTKALNHIFHNEYIYHKPKITQWSLGRLTGPGLFYVQGDKHKFQRKIILRDIWASQIEEDGNVAQVDALSWLSQMTLDVIGRTGFHYDFHALSPEGDANELNKALSIGFHAATRFLIWLMIQSVLPPSSGSAQLRKAKRTMDRIGQELLQESKSQLMTSGRKVDTWRSKDLLSLLVRSNMNTDIPYRQQMSGEDVPTFVFAGHDTISSGTAWSLYALSLHDSLQDRLRKELQCISIHYLDVVVKETLRFHSPAPETARVAVEDNILPLNTPVTDKNGVGGMIFIFPDNISFSLAKELWGEDAMDFKPERWLSKLPEAVNSIPGVWGNMMSFLGGPHGCIGYRYAVLEMKVLLFTLVRAFKIKLAVPKENIINRTSIVQRPYIKGEIEAGGQLPLLISHALRKE
ncbi:cytochrome P450 [Lentinula novae-zelandiae]|nr:cytochrome P450 [Lentinula novae-zelandiae]